MLIIIAIIQLLVTPIERFLSFYLHHSWDLPCSRMTVMHVTLSNVSPGID